MINLDVIAAMAVPLCGDDLVSNKSMRYPHLVKMGEWGISWEKLQKCNLFPKFLVFLGGIRSGLAPPPITPAFLIRPCLIVA